MSNTITIKTDQGNVQVRRYGKSGYRTAHMEGKELGVIQIQGLFVLVSGSSHTATETWRAPSIAHAARELAGLLTGDYVARHATRFNEDGSKSEYILIGS